MRGFVRVGFQERRVVEQVDRKGDCSECDLCRQTPMDVTTVVTDRESKDEDIVTMS